MFLFYFNYLFLLVWGGGGEGVMFGNILHRERHLCRREALLREPILKLVSWWEKYGRQVPCLQRIALCM